MNTKTVEVFDNVVLTVETSGTTTRYSIAGKEIAVHLQETGDLILHDCKTEEVATNVVQTQLLLTTVQVLMELAGMDLGG